MTCSSCGYNSSSESLFCMRCGAPLPSAALAQEDGAWAPTPPPPSHAPPATAQAVPTRRYAGFWMRFFAAFIDGVLIFIAQMIVLIPLLIVVRAASSSVELESAFSLLSWAAGVPINWLYEALMTSSAKQATVGKLALGLRVTDLNGQRLTFGYATGRHFAKYLSSLTLFVGYLIQPFTQRRQALHDIVAGTLVE